MMDLKKLEDFWFVICESKEIKNIPKKYQLLGKDIVVYRNTDNNVLAFLDRCPHRSVPMSDGKVCGNNIICNFHGWEFDQEGNCINIPGMVQKEGKPTNSRLKKYQTYEQHGLVWVRLNTRMGEDYKPYIPAHLSDPNMRSGGHSTHLGCSSLNIAENFLDPFHTPFVHPGIIRVAAKRYRNQIFPKHTDDGLEVLYIKDKPQAGFISLFGREVKKDLGRFRMPGIIELEYYSAEGLEFVNTMYITPRTAESSSIYFRASLRPYILPIPLVFAVAGRAIKFALGQDKWILEKQTDIARKEGGEFYVSTELDIVRNQLINLYSRNNEFVEFKPLEAML
ncbi:MAG: aromatic ring-hydroxylating dioxygenase subunit alpha [Candidatus Sericytochromatia bacterium]